MCRDAGSWSLELSLMIMIAILSGQNLRQLLPTVQDEISVIIL